MNQKVLIIGTRGIPARYGGFETLASNLHRHFEAQNIVVRVLAPNLRKIRLMKGNIYKYLETPIGSFLAVQGHKIHPDSRILIVNPVNLVLASWLRRRGFVVALHMDGRDDLRRKWPWVIRQIYRWLQKSAVRSNLILVFDSETVRLELSNLRKGSDTWTIPYGGCVACSGELRQVAREGKDASFLVLARAEPENQVLKIIGAFEHVLSGSKLNVIATSRHRGKYWRQIVEAVAANPAVVITPGIWSDEVLCDLYRRTDAIIHGHTVGGTNPSLVLALCHGTPVLAHDNPYNREVAGSLARYWKTEQDLTKLLDEFDPVTWPYDQAAVDDFNRRYNWDDVVEKYKRVLGLDQSSSGGQSNGQ